MSYFGGLARSISLRSHSRPSASILSQCFCFRRIDRCTSLSSSGIGDAAQGVVSLIVGALPNLGYLPDNNRSRAALGRLRDALATTQELSA